MLSLRVKAYGIAFLSGAALMVAEVAATRLFIPYFGASLFVWTGTISVILASLSIGYACAARLARKEDVGSILSTALATAGIATTAIPYLVYLIGATLPTWRDLGSGEPALILFSFLLALATLLPAGICYGLVSPLLVELLGREGHHPGETAGRLYAVSTMGSIIGTAGTGALFLPLLGTHLTYASAALVMLVMATLLTSSKKRLLLAMIALLAALVLFFYRPSPWSGEVTLAYVESPYQTIRIMERDGRKELVFNGGLGIQSVYRPETPWTGAYWDWYAVVPTWRASAEKRALIIGYAGGTIARLWAEAPSAASIASVDAVEIDPAVLRLVRQHFSSDDFGAHVSVGDGRGYLQAKDADYDIIAVDAYSNEFQIPFHLATAEFFSSTKDHLTENGLLVMNIALGFEESLLLKNIQNTVATVFPYTYKVASADGLNVLLVATKHPLDLTDVKGSFETYIPSEALAVQLTQVVPDPSLALLTDDRAPLELLSEASLLFAL